MAGLIALGEEEWAVIGPFLARVMEFGGALVVPPGPARALAAARTKEPPLELLDYDFGGGADCSIDVVPAIVAGLDGDQIREQYEEGDMGLQAEQAARAYGIIPAGWQEEGAG